MVAGDKEQLLGYTAVELGRLISQRKLSAVEAMEAVLRQITSQEETLHAYISIDKEAALDRARTVQKKIDAGTLQGPLAGVPMALKDNLCTEGIPTTCASRMLADFVPTYSADAVSRLERAGAVLVGKTNMDEFGMGSTTETSAFGVTRNPICTAHVPGGSSGGSAAAVAAGECFFSLGSDTGGSVRQPAAHCGVVGLKPTYATVSRYGLIAYASSMDQIGPIGKDVTDCAAVLEAITGWDKRDNTCMDREDTDFTKALIADVAGMRIGIPGDYLQEGLDPEVKQAVLLAAKQLHEAGAQVEEMDLALCDYVVPTYYTIASAEASSNLQRFDGIQYGYRAAQPDNLSDLYRRSRTEAFGEEVKRRIMLGTFVLSAGYYDAYYLKACKVRHLIKQAFDKAFTQYDLLLGPVAPTTAPQLGESLADPMQMYLRDLYTIPANLAGLPAISLPCGVDSRGLPIGLQLMANCFQEKKLIQCAYAYEQLSDSAFQRFIE